MWNYDFIIPSLIILILFTLFYFSRRRIPIRLNKTFLIILLVEMATILIDGISSKCLEHNSLFPTTFLKIINVVFFMLFLLRGFFFFIFTADILNIRFSRAKLLTAISIIIFTASELLVLTNLFYPSIFDMTEEGYTRMTFYNAIYISSFYLAITSLILTVIFKNKITNRKFATSLSFNSVLIIGYIVRIIFSNYLIMDTFCLTSLIIIYLSFENPDFYLDEKTGLFNKQALSLLLPELKPESKPFILGFIINNYSDLREIYSGVQMDTAVAMISDYLTKNHPNLYAFYVRDGRFILVGKNIIQGVKIRKDISKRFSEPWILNDNNSIYLDISFVKVSQHLQFTDSEKLLSVLISALNNVSKIDSSNILISDETINITDRNTEIKRAVEKAVEQDSVELFLQPLIDVKTNKIIGAEALSRIRDSDGNIISPVQFIPIAEHNGRIGQLGEQMFEKTCRFIKEHDIKSMGLAWINVNISPIQFMHKNLNNRFSEILNKYGIPADIIHLEITEESMIDYALLQKQIQIMKNSGFQFVLDDYGSGYSNVTRLKSCPFINVKLDMEIVWDYFKRKDKILPTLVETFKQMNFTVTAEGIESIEMADAMKNIGCDFLQGFCFSKPIPAEEFAQKYSINGLKP